MEILDINQKELDKLRDLLKKAKISKYFDVFVQKGVYRVKDLQDYVKDELLIEISMSQPERERFWKYVNQSRPPWWTIKVCLLFVCLFVCLFVWLVGWLVS